MQFVKAKAKTRGARNVKRSMLNVTPALPQPLALGVTMAMLTITHIIKDIFQLSGVKQ